MAELIQNQLAALGLDVTVRTLPVAEMFDLSNQPPNKRPDLMLAFLGGDTLHPDTTFRIPMCLPPNSTIMHGSLSGIDSNSFYPQIFWAPALKRS
jgi:peptide/nickel transport system substrate-binding protein